MYSVDSIWNALHSVLHDKRSLKELLANIHVFATKKPIFVTEFREAMKNCLFWLSMSWITKKYIYDANSSFLVHVPKIEKSLNESFLFLILRGFIDGQLRQTNKVSLMFLLGDKVHKVFLLGNTNN